MPDVNLAVSTAAQKVYAKQCNILYKEFQKTLTSLIKEEQVVRRDLRKLKKDKAVNSRYSLYRTEGADLFSKASQKRKTFRENNLATISPLLDDCFEFTPYGVDSVIAEEEEGESDDRPKTAPGNKSLSPEMKPVDGEVDSVFEANRPKTAGFPLATTSNTKEAKTTSKTEGKSIMKQSDRKFSESGQKDHRGSDQKSIEIDSKEINLPEQKIAQIDRLLKSASQVRSLPIDHEMTSLPDLKSEESDDEDGEVDVQTERTRARKITIKADKFLELEKGNTTVKLKDKDGEFILKPLNINYEPDEVEAVFFAKDPTREKMALVRQKTNWSSQTVSADLKVNNRIAIQKSLMGMSSKKTTVAEIFNNARDRRTRHFRIMLKNPLINAENEEATKERKKSIISVPPGMSKWKSLAVATKVSMSNKSNEKSTASTAVHLYKHQKKLASKQEPEPTTNVNRTGKTRSQRMSDSDVSSKGVGSPTKPQLRVTITSPSGADKNVPLSAKNISKNGDDHSELFHRVKHTPKAQDSKFLNRSTTSFGSREEIPMHLSDRDMTDMIRRMVEGGSDCRSEAPDTKRKKGGGRMQKTSPSVDNISDTESIYFGNVKRLLSSNQARQIIKDLKRRDQEYDDAMLNMRRRVAIGAQGHNTMRRPNSVAAFR